MPDTHRTVAHPTRDPKASPPARRRIQLNRTAVGALVAVVVLSALVYWVGSRFNERGVRGQVLGGARASIEAGKIDEAIRNLGRFLDAHPNDLEALGLLAQLTADSARDIHEAMNAAGVNDRLLRQSKEEPVRQEARRRIVRLYVQCGDWHRSSAVYRLMPESAAFELRYNSAAKIADELIKEGSKAGGARPGDHRLLATALEGLAVPGNPDALARSVEEYELALKGDPKDMATAARLARLCQERLNDPARGERILDALLRALPESPEVRLVRYQYFQKLHDTVRATAELEKATELAGGEMEVRMTAAGDALQRGDARAARRHLDAIPADQQADLRVQVTRGLVDFSEEHPDDAIDGWRKGLLTIGGTNADLTWWLAHALLQMGRISEARPLVVQYRRLTGSADENQPLSRFLQAELDEKTGKPTRAIQSLEWARNQIGDFWQPMLHVALGRCYEAIWDQDRALAAYRRASQFDPRLAEPRLAAARLLMGKPDEAAQEIERGLAQVPDDPSLRVALAGARLRQQVDRPAGERSWAEFEKAMAEAVRATRGNSSLVLMRADQLALSGNMAGAIQVLEKGAVQVLEDGTTVASKNAAIWTAWAEGLNRTGRPAEALGVLERASAPGAAGDKAPIRIARARLLLTMGRGREARDLLIRGGRELPEGDRPALWEALGRIDASRGDANNARLAFTEWARLLRDDPRPRLALLELAETIGDESTVRATVDSLRDIGGPEDIAWRLCRAQELLWSRAGSGPARPRRDPKLEEAHRLLREVLTDAPEVPAAHLLMGQVLERLEKDDDAISAYRRAWERGASAALPRLVELMTKLRRFDDLASLRLRVPSVRLDQLSALASYRAGDVEAARRFVEQAGQEGDRAPGTVAWQAGMLEAIGKRDQADAVLRSIAEKDPARVDPWLTLVRSLAVHEKAKEVAATIGRAKDLIRSENLPLDLARLAWASDDREAADRAFRAALAARPDDVRVQVTASRYFEETGRRDEAIARLRDARKVAPDDRTVVRQLAVILSAEPSSWPEALALIGVDESSGAAADDRLARAMVLANSRDPGRRDEAVALYEALLADLPVGSLVSNVSRDRLIRLLLQTGRAERASQVAAIAAGSGNDPVTVALYAEALLRSGKLIEADHQIGRLEAFRPEDPIVANLRVRCVVASARPDQAAADLERVVRDRTSRPGAEALGRAAYGVLIGLGPQALDQAEQVGQMVARIRESASWMPAQVLARRGRTREALALCPRASESAIADDRRGAAEVAMEVVTGPNADPDALPKADAILGAALRRDPSDYNLLVLSAMFRRLQGRFDDEARLYRSVLELRPGDPVASNNLAWVLSENLGRPDQALAVLDEMIRRSGRVRWTLNTRGAILTRLDRFDDAIRDLKEFAGDSPTPSALFHLARACLKANRLEEFRSYRDQARRAGITPKEVEPTEQAELRTLMAL